MPLKVELLAITPEADRIIETAGRTAYQSAEKVTPGSAGRFIAMIIKRGHESVLEHAWATLRISGVSRALTHQLVRHRLASFTQKSQRYVSEDEFPFVTPESVAASPEAAGLYAEFMDRARRTYGELRRLGVRNEDARFVLPNAVETEIVVTANFREWRHIIGLRGHPASQWEIRRLAINILELLKSQAPAAFADMELDASGRAVVRKVD